HFLVERLIDCRQYAAVHQLSLQVFSENAQLFGEILYSKTFRQCDFAEFARRFRLRLRPDIGRFQFLFSLPLVTLRAIHAIVYGRTPLFRRRRRGHRWCSGPRPWTRTGRSAWCCSTALESRSRRMSGLSLPRPHRPLSRSIEWAALTWGRRRRQPMLFL